MITEIIVSLNRHENSVLINFYLIATASCPALLAAVDFQPMLCEVKSHFICDFFNQTLQFLTLEFMDLSSFNSIQMFLSTRIYLTMSEQKSVYLSTDCISRIQQECKLIDDEKRWLIALISDTGMRLAEAVGLQIGDIKLDGEVPFLRVQKHPWRSLKTLGSERDIPLVGASLWAAQRVVDQGNQFAFPSYTNANKCAANSASGALNKWLKSRVPEGCVIHSLRHSIKDRLRVVECPPDVADAIGGWCSTGLRQKYGSGHKLSLKLKYSAQMIGPTQAIVG